MTHKRPLLFALLFVACATLGWGLAYADAAPVVVAAVPDAPMSTWLLIVITVLSAVSAALHVIAARTTWGAKASTLLDQALDRLKQLETGHAINVRAIAGLISGGRSTAPGTLDEVATHVPDPTKPNGYVSMKLAAIVAVAGLAAAAFLACTEAKNAKAALIDCTTTNYQVATAELAKCTTWACAFDTAIGFGANVGGCALRKMVDDGTQLASTARSATPTSGVATFERFRAQIANGATYRTATGDE